MLSERTLRRNKDTKGDSALLVLLPPEAGELAWLAGEPTGGVPDGLPVAGTGGTAEGVRRCLFGEPEPLSESHEPGLRMLRRPESLAS
jgi:hypothetical protein